MQCVSLPKLSQSIGSKWCSPRSGTTGNSLVGAYTVLQVDPDQTPPVKVDWYGHALLSSHHQNSDYTISKQKHHIKAFSFKFKADNKYSDKTASFGTV